MTAERAARRYSLVDLEVTGHQSFGVLFRTADGESGFVDLADISDVPIGRDEWPAVGYRGTGVVLGTTRAGKLRASLRPADVGLARDVDDPDGALDSWFRVRDRGFADESERDAFFAAPETVAVLRWALSQREPSPDRDRALDVVVDAPERLRAALRHAPSGN
jgi:hypothetical protein